LPLLRPPCGSHEQRSHNSRRRRRHLLPISPRSRSRPPTSATTCICWRARAETSRWRSQRTGSSWWTGQYAALHDKIKTAISTISNQPIKYLINTHFHGDHVGGNEPFARDGATVVCEVNVKNRLAAGTTNGLTGVKTPPVSPAALPAKTYTGAFQIRLRGRVADLRHIENAHTDGDTYVWFKTANVLSTGDTFTNGRYPNIDFANGGNIKGMIAAADAYLKLTNAKTRIVPGHGPLADKAVLTEYRAMLVTARDRMAKLVKDGKSEDDVVAAKPFADLDAKWAPTELASKNFIRVVYHSLADTHDTGRPSFRKLFRRS
jgi:cyclase